MRNFFYFFLVVLYFSTAQAQPYFKADSISPLLLSNPLDRSGDEYKKELKLVIKAQRNFSKEELAQAQRESQITAAIIVEDVMPQLSQKDFPSLYKLLERSGKTSMQVADNAKIYWNTKRPYLVDKRIKPLVLICTNPSYPSGHATFSYTVATIMALLVPNQGEKFIQRAERAAQHRILGGMHFPHDLVGGKEVSLLVIGGLYQNNEFLSDLKKAKDELAASGQIVY